MSEQAAAPSAGAPLHEGAVSNEQAQENAAEELLGSEVEPEDIPKEVVNRKKKYQVKSNGKAREVEVDLDDDEAIKRYIEKAYGADEKFQEAAMTRKQAEQLIEMLRTDPRKILSHPELGIDVKALAHQIINEELEDLAKSPEQKKLEEMERKLKEYEEEKKKASEEKRKTELEKFELEQQQLLDDQITSALQTTSLPKSPYVVKRIADAMIEAFGLGYEAVTPEQVMSYVEDSIRKEITEMFGAMPDEVMEQMLGKSRLDNYRKARVAKAKPATVTAKSVKDTGGSVKPKEEKTEEKPLRFKDVFGPF